MAKKTKQQRIAELESEVQVQTARANMWEHDLGLSQKARKDFKKTFSDILCGVTGMESRIAGMWNEPKEMSEAGILREIGRLIERESLYRIELEDLKLKYHELVRGLAKMPEKASNINDLP
jgi:hypothetical protein